MGEVEGVSVICVTRIVVVFYTFFPFASLPSLFLVSRSVGFFHQSLKVS